MAMDLSALNAIGLDETASKRGHNYVTVFIDMDRNDKPVVFATPGKGKETVNSMLQVLRGLKKSVLGVRKRSRLLLQLRNQALRDSVIATIAGWRVRLHRNSITVKCRLC